MKTTLELGGQPRTFHFGSGFIGNCLDTIGVDFQGLFDMMRNNPYKVIPIMMFESYKFNLWLEDKEPDCTQKDFIRWISEEPDTDDSAQNKWVNEFMESRTKHLPKDEPVKPGKKKPVKRKA